MQLNLLASFAEVMTYISYIILAILILMIMITIHEFGHYIVGKIFKFGINEFSIGFGPKLFQKKRKSGELFSIRALPIGGFCAFKGEDEENDEPDAFNNKKPYQRILVLISGAFMNYVLALLVIALMFGIYGQYSLTTIDLSPAPSGYSKEESFYSRDIILSANGKSVYLTTDLMSAVENKKEGDLVDFTVRRNGENQNVKIKLRCDTDFTSVNDMQKLYSALGIYYETDADGNIQNGGIYSTTVRHGFFETIGRSFEYSYKLAGSILTVIGQLLTGRLGVSAVGGTITTVVTTAEAIQIGGFMYFLNMMAFIGVNLAVFNLLPVPALDGSRVIFTAIEWVRKKPLNRKVEAIIHTVGLFVILLFAIFVDLQQCF